MQFCDDCGALLPASEATGECEQCGAQFEQSTPSRGRDGEPSTDRAKTSTALERLPTTKNGSIKKADAVEWLTSLDNPSSAELRRATVEKPSGFSGSTFPTDVSTIRLTGDPEFIETVAGLFTWIVDMEDYSRRVEINLKETEDRETGETTGNYALYLSVAERG
jgi:DNA-directed RNA polymerase subunit M/transcription elongation factor TFIIS